MKTSNVKKRVAIVGHKTVHRAIELLKTSDPIRLEQRSAGVLMHLTSLPGPFGTGDLGPAAYRFADFLSQAGQRWWQMLPVTPLGAAPGYSPYSSDSACAGSPYLVSLEALAAEGLLSADEISPRPPKGAKANFYFSNEYRQNKLRKAYERFAPQNGKVRAGFEEFRASQSLWLPDYSLFCALKNRHGGAEWCTWDRDLRSRKPAALEHARHELRHEIAFHEFVQYQFDRQWQKFRAHCRSKNIGLIGDVPIFVAHDAADVWAHRHLFDLDKSGQPTCVTGYPPDIFNSDGQRWGHPHFIWEQHKAENYAWWLNRFRSTLARFDALRIDHFLGFHQSWSIPIRAKAVAEGKWIAGGGADFFRAVRKEIGEGAQMIAEDLGDISAAALALRDGFGLPGMRVLQFAFKEDQYHRPHLYPKRCVAYTGTHDNDTIVGWYQKLLISARRNKSAARELALAREYAGVCDDHSAHWAFIRSLYASQANTVIIPMQDLLGFGTEHRMNIPGTAEGNWDWRLAADQPNLSLAQKMREMSGLFSRCSNLQNGTQ